MEIRFEYLSNPATLISLAVFLFSLGMTYANLKYENKQQGKRILDLEEKIKEINADEIRASLIRMETNLDRVVVAIKDLQSKK